MRSCQQRRCNRERHVISSVISFSYRLISHSGVTDVRQALDEIMSVNKLQSEYVIIPGGVKGGMQAADISAASTHCGGSVGPGAGVSGRAMGGRGSAARWQVGRLAEAHTRVGRQLDWMCAARCMCKPGAEVGAGVAAG